MAGGTPRDCFAAVSPWLDEDENGFRKAEQARLSADRGRAVEPVLGVLRSVAPAPWLGAHHQNKYAGNPAQFLYKPAPKL